MFHRGLDTFNFELSMAAKGGLRLSSGGINDMKREGRGRRRARWGETEMSRQIWKA